MPIVEFRLANGEGEVAVEIDDTDDLPFDELERAGFGTSAVRRAALTWDNALEVLRPAAEGVFLQFAQMKSPPAEIEISFGVKLSGTIGAHIVSTGGEYHLGIKVIWRPPDVSLDELQDGLG